MSMGMAFAKCSGSSPAREKQLIPEKHVEKALLAGGYANSRSTVSSRRSIANGLRI
jgi:hypothetical protein